MPAVELRHVTKTFGSFVAVDELDFAVPEKSIFGFLGPNGAGKTTSIRMIMNIFTPDAGTILFEGLPIDETVKSRIGYLPEERGLYRKLRVAEQLVYLARLRGLEASHARRRAAELLDRLELAAWAKRKIENLSKGMQQKLQFAAAVIHRPSLLILDEPFSGLDPVNAQMLSDWIIELRDEGTTIILSAHQMETVEKLCDSIALVNRGRLLIEGNLKEIKRGFGRSRVRLELDGANGYVPDLPSILSATGKDGRWEIQLEDERESQELLAQAMKQGRISKFEIAEPSLHEIFVQLVKGKK